MTPRAVPPRAGGRFPPGAARLARTALTPRGGSSVHRRLTAPRPSLARATSRPRTKEKPAWRTTPAIPGPEPVNEAAPAAEAEMTSRKAPADKDAPRPRAHDLTGGTRGMTSSSYVVGGLDKSRLAEDGTPVHRFCQYAILAGHQAVRAA